MSRAADLDRKTSEVVVSGRIELDGLGRVEVATGLGFLDHMLATLAKHGGFDLDLSAAGDTSVDGHHTVEDCAIALGRGLDAALGDRDGIRRFADAHVALDEALVRSVVDLSGRPWPEIHLDLATERIGDVAAENIVHFFRTFAIEGRMALHIDLLRGDNAHHQAEAAFKATARAMRDAVQLTVVGVPSTKGSLR
jgi:imidazoleglycerol phosphate dehydratase HisB